MSSDDCTAPLAPPDRMRGPDAKGMYPWVALLGLPAWELAREGVPGRPAWAAAAGLLAAGVLYVATVRRAFAVPRRPVGWTFPALTVLSTLLAAVYHGAWYTLFIVAAIAAGTALRRTGPYVATGLAAVAVVVELTGAAPGAGTGAVSLAWGTFTAGLVPWVILRLFDAIHQLRRTREELARAAVERERLRFSRDLHDLLGHTLSVMVVKAEVVRRMAPRDAAAAARQAADIERIGRRALAEVRAAVTGYRGRGLAAELDSARRALADAGIAPTIRVAAGDLPPETDALLGWAVREGTTNVLRHSGAATCGITLERGDGEVLLRIEDDGRGAPHPESPGARHGHGLVGLRERVAAADGRLTFGPRPAGGSRLLVRVPLPRTSGDEAAAPDGPAHGGEPAAPAAARHAGPAAAGGHDAYGTAPPGAGDPARPGHPGGHPGGHVARAGAGAARDGAGGGRPARGDGRSAG